MIKKAISSFTKVSSAWQSLHLLNANPHKLRNTWTYNYHDYAFFSTMQSSFEVADAFWVEKPAAFQYNSQFSQCKC